MIHYEIHCVAPKIYAVIVPNADDRSLLFCRIQEYSESPNPRFRGKDFDMHDFVQWYQSVNGGKFTYARDWQGFNVSFRSAIKCYGSLPSALYTFYDHIFVQILARIVASTVHENAYIISSESLKSITMQHEMFHALYYTKAAYRRKTDEALAKLPRSVYHKLRSNLIGLGYFDNDYVIHNEMQAYMRGRDWTHPNTSAGIPRKLLKQAHQLVASELSDSEFELPKYSVSGCKSPPCDSKKK